MILSVKFRSSFKVFNYELNQVNQKNICVGSYVICKTQNGLEYGRVCGVKLKSNIEYGEQEFDEGFVRAATDVDRCKHSENLQFEKHAILVGRQCVKSHKLAMKLVLVVGSFDRSKLIFFFTSNGRVDFRKLVRHMASIFRTRVELRQIGIRDEAKILSGIGMCGRVFCCSSYLNEFNHVSIKMAKIQNLSLNPRKISGCCGRLMCCLQHENDAYVELSGKSPDVGDRVLTPVGEGVVVSKNLLFGEFKVSLNELANSVTRIFNLSQLKKMPKLSKSAKPIKSAKSVQSSKKSKKILTDYCD